MRLSIAQAFSVLTLAAAVCNAAGGPGGGVRNTTYYNPTFPGWHSDASCVFVPELDDTTFCVTSSFLNFPGLPVYASRDLVQWKHVSSAFTRPEQIPGHAAMNGNPRAGVWAPTIRYREGTFYVIVTYVDYSPKEKAWNLLFESDDPYDDGSWSNPHTITNPTGGNHIDPDLFWDEDGQAYMATGWGTIFLSTIDLQTGNASERVSIWDGSGDRNPEGPHIYRKDGYYYLVVAEGGAALNHSATIARATDIYGPYEGYPDNPFLTNRGTDSLFQTVGHADLFSDSNGNWWVVATTTRSGPKSTHYPMGRESVLVPVSWDEGAWPVASPVRGTMTGPLPNFGKKPTGSGPYTDGQDRVDFSRGSSLPRHFLHFRSRNPAAYTVSPHAHRNTLRLEPSKSNLTGGQLGFDVADGVTFVGRRQSASLFEFSVDVAFEPEAPGEEAGVSVFLNQQQHIDMGIRWDDDLDGPKLFFGAVSLDRPNAAVPDTVTKRVPRAWARCPVRLAVAARDVESFVFSASSSCGTVNIEMGLASSDIVSGGFLGTSPFIAIHLWICKFPRTLTYFVPGTLLGIYATSHNGTGEAASYWSRWRYNPVAQQVDNDKFVKA